MTRHHSARDTMAALAWCALLLLLALLRPAAANPTAAAGGDAATDAPPLTLPPALQPVQALDPLDPTAAIEPVKQEELYLEAMRAIAAGQPEVAAPLLMRFLEQEPRHAGAWLDLAISQCELGHAEEAERLFQETEKRFHPPAGIMEVIQGYRARGCSAAPAPRSQLSLSIGRGYDNNVTQGSSSSVFVTGSGDNAIEYQLAPDYLPRADHYSQFAGDLVQPLDASGTDLIVQLRARQNDHINSQNTASGLLGIERPWHWHAWAGRATAAYGMVQLGGELYQRQSQLQLRVDPPLPLPERVDWSLTAGSSHVVYPTRTHFDANTLELSSSASYRGPVMQVVGAFGWLDDHGDAERLGGDRHGTYGSVQLYGHINDNLNAELGWTTQQWRSADVYSPGLIDTVRRQQTDQLRAALVAPLKLHHSLLLEWRAVRNRENISLFQYNSRVIQLSYRWDTF